MRENGMNAMRWMIYHLIMIGFLIDRFDFLIDSSLSVCLINNYHYISLTFYHLPSHIKHISSTITSTYQASESSCWNNSINWCEMNEREMMVDNEREDKMVDIEKEIIIFIMTLSSIISSAIYHLNLTISIKTSQYHHLPNLISRSTSR